MISEEESFRTTDHDIYFMITDNIINDTPWQFSSDWSLMEPDETDEFLKQSRVI